MAVDFYLMEKVSNASSAKLQSGATFIPQLVRPNRLFQHVRMGTFTLGMVLFCTQICRITLSYIGLAISLKSPKC